MSHNFELTNDVYSLEIAPGFSHGPIEATEPLIPQFLKAVVSLDAIMPLVSISLNETTESLIYDYLVMVKDGRKWVQKINLREDVRVTYDCRDIYWCLTEVSAHNSVRRVVVAIAQKYRVKKIELKRLHQEG